MLDTELTNSDPTSAPSADELLGLRLRAARKRSGARLQDVAQQADISVSMLSQIERGISSPSIRMLRSICHVLQIDGEVLFATPQTDSSVGREFVVRAHEQPPLVVGGVRKHRLTPQACSQLEGFLIDIAADSVLDPKFVIQEGDKIGYVLKGRLRLFVGDLEIHLEAGDAYGFPTGQRFRWENGWAGETQILVINGKHFYV